MIAFRPPFGFGAASVIYRRSVIYLSVEVAG